MSWSVSFIGKPEKVAEAVEQYANELTGQSKEEYEAAAPHLAGLVRQNKEESGGTLLVTLNASGHGTSKDGKIVTSSCAMDLKTSWAKVLV